MIWFDLGKGVTGDSAISVVLLTTEIVRLVFNSGHFDQCQIVFYRFCYSTFLMGFIPFYPCAADEIQAVRLSVAGYV